MATRTTGGSSGKRPSAPSSHDRSKLPYTPDELLDADLLAEQPSGLDGSDLRTRHAALLAAGGSLGSAIDDVAEAIGQCIDEIRRRSLVTHVLEQSRRKLVVVAQHVKDIEAAFEDSQPIAEGTVVEHRLTVSMGTGTVDGFNPQTHFVRWSNGLEGWYSPADIRPAGDTMPRKPVASAEDTGETIPSPRPAPDPIVADGEDPLLNECMRIWNATHGGPRAEVRAILSFLRAKWAQAPEAMQCLDGEEDCDACP